MYISTDGYPIYLIEYGNRKIYTITPNKRDNILHNDKGPAVIYNDGRVLYAWEGEVISKSKWDLLRRGNENKGVVQTLLSF